MDMRNRLMGGLAGIVLGSTVYVAQGCAPMLSVKVNGVYFTCDTSEGYDSNHPCYGPVAEYRAAHPTRSSSSSSKSSSSDSFMNSAADRAQARAEAKAALTENKGGHWVCPE